MPLPAVLLVTCEGFICYTIWEVLQQVLERNADALAVILLQHGAVHPLYQNVVWRSNHPCQVNYGAALLALA